MKSNAGWISSLQAQVVDIAHRAGMAIMEIYAQGEASYHVVQKPDHTPLTVADSAAHQLICESLRLLTPGLPILSEESSADEIASRHEWSSFWLVDPLDGTREFIRRSGEFTVNIALIQNGRVLLSVVEAPALKKGYTARNDGPALGYRVSNTPPHMCNPSVLKVQKWDFGNPLRMLASRSHERRISPPWYVYLPDFQQRFLGSSLKFCEIAAGNADLYVRPGPTNEWDTAAGQLVLERAGGHLLALDDRNLGTPLRYNQRDTLLNPDFVAFSPNVDQPLRRALTQLP